MESNRLGQLLIVFVVIPALFFSSCTNRLVGTWNITHYQNTTPGQKGIDVYNIGTITFKKNHTGEKNINYFLQNNYSDSSPFNWESTSNYLTIQGNSPLAKIWIRVDNKRSYQLLKSTNGSTEVQTLELKKE